MMYHHDDNEHEDTVYHSKLLCVVSNKVEMGRNREDDEPQLYYARENDVRMKKTRIGDPAATFVMQANRFAITMASVDMKAILAMCPGTAFWYLNEEDNGYLFNRGPGWYLMHKYDNALFHPKFSDY
jgi:hypothetical protein